MGIRDGRLSQKRLEIGTKETGDWQNRYWRLRHNYIRDVRSAQKRLEIKKEETGDWDRRDWRL